MGTAVVVGVEVVVGVAVVVVTGVAVVVVTGVAVVVVTGAEVVVVGLTRENITSRLVLNLTGPIVKSIVLYGSIISSAWLLPLTKISSILKAGGPESGVILKVLN